MASENTGSGLLGILSRREMLSRCGVGMGLLGMGNGSVFQLLPQRFTDQVGIMTGIVGAAGNHRPPHLGEERLVARLQHVPLS